MSKKTLKATLPLLLCIGLAIPLAGCKTIGFDKPSLPSLAFWKKDRDSELPPPPARHFDPARFDSEGGEKSQLANTKGMYDQYGLKRKASSPGSYTDSAAKDFSSDNQSTAINSPSKAYGMEDFSSDADVALNSTKNSFDLNANEFKNKFAENARQAEAGLSDAQQKFRSAMEAVPNPLDIADNSFSGSSFPTKSVSNNNSTNSFGGFDATAAANSFAAKKNSLDAKVQNSLYDLNGKLRSASDDLQSQARNALQSPTNSQLKSEFEKRLEVARNAAKKGANNANQQLEALAGVSAQTRDAISMPFSKMTNDGLSMPSAQTAGLKPNPTTDSLQFTKPDQLASTKNLANDTVKSMRSEIEEARRQIEILKQQFSVAKSATGEKASLAAGQTRQTFDSAANVVRNQTVRAADAIQNTVEGIVLPSGNANSNANRKRSTRVASQNNQFGGGTENLRSSSMPASKSPTNRTLQPQNNGNSSGGSFYPSTPYGNFGSNQKSLVPSPLQSTIGQVKFDSPQANSQATGNARADLTAEANFGVSRIDSYVPEVRIPAAILTGKSSYAPGSTTPLKR